MKKKETKVIKLGKNESLSSVIDHKNQEVHTVQGDEMRYNRRQRRNGKFAIQNNQNALFINYREDKKTDKAKVKDVELEEATIWTFNGAKYMISKLLVAQPNLNIGYVLVVKMKNGKRRAI